MNISRISTGMNFGALPSDKFKATVRELEEDGLITIQEYENFKQNISTSNNDKFTFDIEPDFWNDNFWDYYVWKPSLKENKTGYFKNMWINGPDKNVGHVNIPSRCFVTKDKNNKLIPYRDAVLRYIRYWGKGISSHVNNHIKFFEEKISSLSQSERIQWNFSDRIPIAQSLDHQIHEDKQKWKTYEL